MSTEVVHSQPRRTPEDFPALDGLRAIAVLFVMIGHLAPSEFLQKLVGWGLLGVLLFFCLSGFLITNILLKIDCTAGRMQGLRAFYARRFLRIFPIYYLVIAIAVCVRYTPVTDNLLRLVTYTLNIPGLPPTLNLEAASHLWSLSVEEQFYCVWPIVVLFAPRRSLKAILIATILASLCYKMVLAVTGQPYWMIFRPIAGCIDSLAIGSLVAVRRNQGTDRTISVPMLAIALVVYAVVTYCRFAFHIDPRYTGVLPIGVVETFVCAVVFALIITFVTQRKENPFSRALGVPPLRAIARISYGLYLYHFFMPDIVVAIYRNHGMQTWHPHFTSLFINPLCLSFLAAIASWYCIEAPLLKLKTRFAYSGKHRISREQPEPA